MTLRFAITVDFELVPGTRDEFLPLVRENAAASLRDEPGCSRSDGRTFREGGGNTARVFLYEVYDDRPAFEAHVRMPHFKSFDAATKAMVQRKTVVAFDLWDEGTA